MMEVVVSSAVFTIALTERDRLKAERAQYVSVDSQNAKTKGHIIMSL